MRILAIAYACEPDKGSEPGAGWTWVRMLATFADVHVITRENNREPIEQSLRHSGGPGRLSFSYHDLPPKWRRWKRGPRGVRMYYLLWQISLGAKLRRTQMAREYDVVWHLTMANVWLGSGGALLERPFIYGPVGGGPNPPLRLLRTLGWPGIRYEMARTLVRGIARYFNPLARASWRKASLILVQNPDTQRWLPRRHRGKTLVFPHAVAEDVRPKLRKESRKPKVAIYAGRLEPWKGLVLALDALARAPEWTLIVCGEGSDKRRLQALARDLELQDRVHFKGWLSRNEVEALVAGADVFLFPSFHDDSPLAIVEALSVGVPVVCLDRGGPTILTDGGGVAVRATTPARTAIDLAAALPKASTLSEAATLRAGDLSTVQRARELRALSSEVIASPKNIRP